MACGHALASRVHRTSGSRATAAAPTRRGMPGRCLRTRRISRARCRFTTRPRRRAGCWCLTLIPAGPRTADGGAVRHDRQRAAAEVAAQAATIGELVARLGGQVLADVAPSGGRHVFVLFAAALPWRELRDLARAIALRFPAVDPAPMCSLGGQISPPGPGTSPGAGGCSLRRRRRQDGRRAPERARGVGRRC